MNNNNVLEEFFIWEENNSIELKNNCLNNNDSVHYDTTTEIKNDSIKKDWRDITDPKLRKKMRDKAYHKDWYEANKDIVLKKQKKYNDENKDKRKIYLKNWGLKNKDKIKLKKSEYYIENKDVISKRIKTYVENNKDIVRHRRNKYERRKTKDDIQFRISKNLRRRLRNTLNNKTKSGSAVKDLGCSIESFKTYLEIKFQPGMTWNNYGMYGWHIDHIKPLSSFDLSDRNQFLEACHYTNLQPLWAQDNLTKSNKLI
jgi:hypothetical protein